MNGRRVRWVSIRPFPASPVVAQAFRLADPRAERVFLKTVAVFEGKTIPFVPVKHYGAWSTDADGRETHRNLYRPNYDHIERSFRRTWRTHPEARESEGVGRESDFRFLAKHVHEGTSGSRNMNDSLPIPCCQLSKALSCPFFFFISSLFFLLSLPFEGSPSLSDAWFMQRYAIFAAAAAESAS